MNGMDLSLDLLHEVFEPGPRGVVGLVEDVLALCDERGLALSWEAGRCQVRPSGSPAEQAAEVPLPGSVFQAALARFAALCNESLPDSVSPYGGEGEFSIASHSPATFRVAFANTPAEQTLELRRLAPHPNGETAGDAATGHAPVRPR